jgi:hypothetical protein
MSLWPRTAIEPLPELKTIIDIAENPMMMWIELHLKWERAYAEQLPNDDFIRRIYKYALWCVARPQTNDASTDMPTAVTCAFYESIPLDKRVSANLHRWLTYDDCMGLESVFRYPLSEDEFQALRATFDSDKLKPTRQPKAPERSK